VPSADNKTQPTDSDVATFIDSIEDPRKREDAAALLSLLGEVTGESPKMWGPSIVGFGKQHYAYASGRQGDWFVLGFSPRKQNLTLYLPGYLEQLQPVLDRLGKHSTGKGCLYVKRLSDVDPNVLRELLETSVAAQRERSASQAPS
jgi:hypothetical protein